MHFFAVHDGRYEFVTVEEPETALGTLDIAILESNIHALSLPPLEI